MRSIDSTRPALSLVTSTDRPPAAVLRTCRCGWQVFRDGVRSAEMDWAAHQVEEHATFAERARIEQVVMAWQDEFAAIDADLPARLVVQAVHEAMSAAGIEEVAA